MDIHTIELVASRVLVRYGSYLPFDFFTVFVIYFFPASSSSWTELFYLCSIRRQNEQLSCIDLYTFVPFGWHISLFSCYLGIRDCEFVSCIFILHAYTSYTIKCIILRFIYGTIRIYRFLKIRRFTRYNIIIVSTRRKMIFVCFLIIIYLNCAISVSNN